MEETIKDENILSLNPNEILKKLPNVENMTSSRGNDIPNQFIIKGEDFTLFQSYKSPIAMFMHGKVFIFSDWDYSTTTGKYRNQFLNETKQETIKKLLSGEYIAVGFETDYLKSK